MIFVELKITHFIQVEELYNFKLNIRVIKYNSKNLQLDSH